jgi:hypothetical protein
MAMLRAREALSRRAPASHVAALGWEGSMTDALTAFRQAHALEAPAAAPGSRYHGVPVESWTGPGRPGARLDRPAFPAGPREPARHGRGGGAGRRPPDTLAARALGDPSAWWRLADAAGVFDPAELSATPGARVPLTLPPGSRGGRPAMTGGVRLLLMIGPWCPSPRPPSSWTPSRAWRSGPRPAAPAASRSPVHRPPVGAEPAAAGGHRRQRQPRHPRRCAW